MHAKVGEWLVVQHGTQTSRSRRAEIRAVSDTGEPLFAVRSADTGRVAIVFAAQDAIRAGR